MPEVSASGCECGLAAAGGGTRGCQRANGALAGPSWEGEHGDCTCRPVWRPTATIRQTDTSGGLQAVRRRQRKLIAKIDCAIRRLYEGEYGYCEVTGDPISLARLEARPIATMTLEAQEQHERVEKVSRDD